MKKALVIFILNLICYLSNSQIESIIWQHCLGTDSQSNMPYTVENTNSGYMIGIGLGANGPGISNYHGGGDAWIVSMDFSGNIIWERCFGGSDGDRPDKIIRINDSSYYLLNTSFSSDGDVQNGRSGNFWVVKINGSGAIEWENSYGGSLVGEEVRDAILMPDNGLICMGRISSTGGDVTTHYGDMDIWLFRIDSQGNLLWEKTFGNHGKDNAIKIKLTSGSTVLMIGCHDESGGMIDCQEPYSTNADVWIIEMDLHANIINQWCYGGKYWDQGKDIVEISDGYVFTATTNSNDGDVSGLHGQPGGYDDIWTVKIDFQGNLIWQQCVGGYAGETSKYITKTAYSGLIIIGSTTSHDGDVTGNHTTEWNEYDIWVVNLSNDGPLIWEHCFGGLQTEKFWGLHSVLKLDDYNFVIGAISNDASGDVTCDLFPYDLIPYNAWLFEIKDCSYYMPLTPDTIIGPDTICSTVNPESHYFLETVPWATGYEWKIEPDSAGIFFLDSASIYANWNPLFEGTVTVKARSYNDCGYSEWSSPHITQVFSCLGVKEQGGMEAWKHGVLEISPNPASGIVDCRWSIVDGRGEGSLVMYDIFGKIISLPRLGEGQGGGSDGREGGARIDVSSLPPGVYFVSVLEDGKRVAGGKVVVAR